MSEEDADGFTPLGRELKEYVDYEGFNGLADAIRSVFRDEDVTALIAHLKGI